MKYRDRLTPNEERRLREVEAEQASLRQRLRELRVQSQRFMNLGRYRDRYARQRND